MRFTRLVGTLLGSLALALALATIPLALAAQNAPAPSGGGAGGLINEALSKPVQMDLQNTTLLQAMRGIGDKTGVRIEAERAVWELLPWGDQTRITAKVDNQPLQAALQAIVQKLGLEYVVKENAVELRPIPALRRLGRRATAVELGALDLLGSTPLNLTKNRPTVRELVEAVDQKLLEMKAPYAVEFRTGQDVNPDKPVAVTRNATLADGLEELAHQTGATWYPWGNDIVIVSKEDQVRNQLQKTVTVRFTNADVGQVLSELSQLSGVDFDLEPGAIQRLPPTSRTIRLLSLENRSIRQALEDVSGITGLAYAITKDGVSITNPQQPAAAGAAASQDPVVGMFTVADGVQVMLRESQVPPDVLEYIRHRREQAVKVLRDQMKQENFVPPPAPAAPTTRPAGKKSDGDL